MKLSLSPCLSVVLIALIATQASSQTPAAAPGASEFDAAKTVFDKQLGELEAARKTVINAARARYVAALDVAEKKATAAAKLDAVRAVLAEKEAANQDAAMTPAPPPALPADLSPVRNAYIRECERVAKTTGPRAQGLATTYLRSLAAAEAKAKAAADAALLDRINSEKTRAASYGVASGSTNAARPSGKNALVNGEFSQFDGEGSPTGWGGSKGRVVTERGETFLRLEDGSRQQKVPVPAGAKSVRVSGRMRSGDFIAEPKGKFQSMDIAVLIVGGAKSGSFLMNQMVRGGSRSWSKVDETKSIPAGATELEISLTRWDARSATIDYDDVEVIFR